MLSGHLWLVAIWESSILCLLVAHSLTERQITPIFALYLIEQVLIFVVSLRLHMLLLYIISEGDRVESYRSERIWKGQDWECL